MKQNGEVAVKPLLFDAITGDNLSSCPAAVIASNQGRNE